MTKSKTNKPATEEPANYESAWAELQKILSDVQSGSVGIDDLGARIERMSELIQYCRNRLRNTEDAINRLSSE